jgi:hypothetical protein
MFESSARLAAINEPIADVGTLFATALMGTLFAASLSNRTSRYSVRVSAPAPREDVVAGDSVRAPMGRESGQYFIRALDKRGSRGTPRTESPTNRIASALSPVLCSRWHGYCVRTVEYSDPTWLVTQQSG